MTDFLAGDDLDGNFRILTPKEVPEAVKDAKRRFLAMLEPGGLTVTVEASERWWPAHLMLR